MEAEARRELARVVADGLDQFRAALWLGALTFLTDACAALGDEATAALVYPELAPQAGENVMIGHLVTCHGAADRYLGMLAATCGEWERAEEHFERALELNRRWAARPGSPTPRTSTRAGCCAAAPAERERGRALLGEAAGSPRDRHAGAARPRPGARLAAAPAAADRDGLSPARCRSSPSSPAA